MKTIRNILLTLLSLVACISLGSCSKDKAGISPSTFEVLTNTIPSSKEAGMGVLTLSEGGFTHKVSADWCSLKAKDATTLEVSLTGNSSAEMRSCIITLSKGDTEILVPVHQMGTIYEVKELKSFTLARAGGEKRFAVVGNKELSVTYKSSADWLTYKVENGELIFTAMPLTAGASREVEIRVQAELFDRTIVVRQQLAREDLLGAYTIDYITDYNTARRTAEVQIVKLADDKFQLQGLAAPVSISIDPETFAISIPSQKISKPNPAVEAGQEVRFLAWAAGYPKADGNPNYAFAEETFMGTLVKNVDQVKFTFASTTEGSQMKGLSFHVFDASDNWKAFYYGSNKMASVIDFSLTKK